ncbi:DUF1997 domain-containing protein [Prosthecochloris sp. SCSIO W1102]|uniref:DUF1997 domain-containing protein n=1 Tax=Prosthecochloris sp. SCSIO W1102 TaxID=2992243 RepID=UPI00223CD9F8|nr:DUF1997 domain-containing protein [Prosthecochloris sp. SCSIO W1102]UZJ39519.1 DUF1997 domain-containing protein [Prosthecochloris sp. SCSIO W1102]
MDNNFEIKATGKSKGEWIFHGEFHETVDYLSNHKRILEFNPFCYEVEKTDIDNIYKWHFRVTDPQNNPFDVIFFIEEKQELMVILPDEYEDMDPDNIPENIIHESIVGKKIIWEHYPTDTAIDDPKNYIFEGKAFAEMYVHPHKKAQTKVDFDLKINVRFMLYPAFRIIPEKVIKNMTNAGMSFIMQTATNKMFQSISKDFGKIQPA